MCTVSKLISVVCVLYTGFVFPFLTYIYSFPFSFQVSAFHAAYDELCSFSGATAVPYFLMKYSEENVEVALLKDWDSFFTNLKKVQLRLKMWPVQVAYLKPLNTINYIKCTLGTD